MPVDTKTAERRDLRLSSMEELRSELDRIQAAHDAGTLSHTGNWSPGQVLEHLAIFMECAFEGFPSRAPFFVRWIAIPLFKKKAVSGEPMPPGFKLPKQASFMLPGDATTFEQGMSRLRDCLARLDAGDRFTHPSPLLGKLSHEQWIRMQLGHCSMHLSFLSY